MASKLTGMQRSLTRAIFREAKQLQKQGPKMGSAAAVQLPAIYDICNSVNPSSGGLLLGDQMAYRSFVQSQFDSGSIAQELQNYGKLRKTLPSIMEQMNTPPKKQTVKLSEDFYSKPSFIQFEGAKNYCPFEVLRAFKYQNSMRETSSTTECNGISLSAVTGFAKEISKDAVGENIFSYNIMFANNTDKPVRILGHNIVFKQDCGSELKSEYYQGVNNTLPVIEPGDHYICGATVAFPEELQNLCVGGSFEILEEGMKGEQFESMALEKKWGVLKSAIDHGESSSFTTKLQDTKFSFDVVCDTQPLSEKFPVVEEVEEATIG